jgi:hypothetical protein
MGALLQALEIIFGRANQKEWWKNNKKKNKLFNLQNTFFSLFFSLSLNPSYF